MQASQLIAIPRLGFRLPKLRDLEIFLDEELWVCFDHSQNDFPVLAWTDFKSAQRAGLHEKVPCTLRLYHNHAEIIIDKVLTTVYDLLEEELDHTGLPRKGEITSLENHKQKNKDKEDE